MTVKFHAPDASCRQRECDHLSSITTTSAFDGSDEVAKLI
jgi:hypothetical protein